MKYIQASEKAKRCAHYLSIEFLIGRVFYNNLLELGVLQEVSEILKEKGVDIALFEEIEDAALGNGGLGRLAACYMDSGAAVGIPLYGYGIRYKYGLFRQKFEDGFQKEVPDDWQRFGDPWSIRKEDEKQIIRFADMQVNAVPYDMPLIGKRVNVLRLYQAEGSENAEKISGVLYPPDDTEDGKLLRIRQEYFLSAAAIVFCGGKQHTAQRHASRVCNTGIDPRIARARADLPLGIENRKTGFQLYEPHDFAGSAGALERAVAEKDIAGNSGYIGEDKYVREIYP